MSQFTVKNLSYWRDDHALFQPLSFKLCAGEGVALHGRNGSGKTTLLEVLAGLRKSYQGQFYWNNEPAPNDAYRQSVLYVGHKNALHPHLTGYEMLGYFISLAGRGDSSLLSELIAAFDLSQHMDKRTTQLSAGQARKLSLLRLAAIPSQLWILDEPFTNCDQPTTQALQTLLQRHSEKGGMVLLTTHQTLTLPLSVVEILPC